MMKKSGFKTVIFNLPSGNAKTIEKLGITDNTIENIIESIKLAKKAGLFIDIMIKIGYPWETDEDIILAIKEIEKCSGGITVVKNGKVLDTLQLKIAGIMSDDSPKDIVKKIYSMHELAYNELNVNREIDNIINRELKKDLSINHKNELKRVPRYNYHKGLAIGNVTSQILAIFYLNRIDHLIKEKLGCKYYIRYMDGATV